MIRRVHAWIQAQLDDSENVLLLVCVAIVAFFFVGLSIQCWRPPVAGL